MNNLYETTELAKVIRNDELSLLQKRTLYDYLNCVFATFGDQTIRSTSGSDKANDTALKQSGKRSDSFKGLAKGFNILLDNCGATHFVNDKNLLVLRSIQRFRLTDFIEARTSSLLVVGRRTKVFKRALNGPNGARTEDLKLENVAIVKGFNVNIISEALLSKAGVWYSGYNATFRYGKVKESVVLRKRLQTRHKFQKSSVFRALKEDLSILWHLRIGHLSKEALEALAYNAKGVKLKGITKVECEAYAITHAQ
ncbi:polyprotein [Drepanopeziza brunnea f. sp. 'multigermtubi' MB_m1]|uniref:Polyprotein n=1 Tax=Marssonina brunnea f. sp. multigermtubi (strain MB_m1) TaxID=1072389 RepID=K1WX95_MARBU|nr:polyprotein [Drepanopeziza brunnea f. sp. 'multigermtubi' MB_m1]EKD13308.1 polyprotein [Drepanopeziza brunnea f. sp. 'multigermtubi' MB_m1]